MPRVEHLGADLSFENLAEKATPNEVDSICLTDVTITGNEDDMYTFVRSIRGHPNILELSLRQVACAQAGVSLDHFLATALISWPKIEILSLHKVNLTTSTISCIGFCSTLKELHLCDCQLTDEDGAAIAAAVASSGSIETVVLTSDNELPSEVKETFSQLLKEKAELHTIKLNGLVMG